MTHPIQQPPLTAREVQVRDLVRVGHTNQEIGDVLGISEETVKRHLSSIFDKLKVRNRTELAILFVNTRQRDKERCKELRIEEAFLRYRIQRCRAELKILQER